MVRRLLCETCGKQVKPLHPLDLQNGWKRRSENIIAKKPEIHQMEIINDIERKISPIPYLLCDNCGEIILDGQNAIAETMYRGEEPEEWESEYGKII